MFEEEIRGHIIFFSGASLIIGRIHWYLQKAYFEMERRRYIKQKEKFGFVKIVETPFGEEVGNDEIHWWIFNKETNIVELEERTKDVLKSVQKLKDESTKLRTSFSSMSYIDLIKKIKIFTEQNKEEIETFYDYVVGLYTKNPLAPCILFTYRVWGSTKLSDRMIKITAERIDEDLENVKRCTEIALGLIKAGMFTIEDFYHELFDEYLENIDPEYRGQISLPTKHLYDVTNYNILTEFANYFEFLRQSLRNILLEIEEYNSPNQLLDRETFWSSFIKKAMCPNRIETQLWDFKETFEMWHVTREKGKFEHEFCEQIASYANTNGGVLIVGVTNEPPRLIEGVPDLENKLKFCKSVLKIFIEENIDFVEFKQIIIQDDSGLDKNCLLIVIAQTKAVIPVKDEIGRYTYPIRLATGLGRTSYDKINESKSEVFKNNFNFLRRLDAFVHDC